MIDPVGTVLTWANANPVLVIVIGYLVGCTILSLREPAVPCKWKIGDCVRLVSGSQTYHVDQVDYNGRCSIVRIDEDGEFDKLVDVHQDELIRAPVF